MCGICGVLYFDDDYFVEKSKIRRMTKSLIARGPDDEGFYVKRNIGMGIRRLAIIDIKGGQQPVSNESGSLVATLNGELYNFKEIRKYGLRSIHHFRSNCDTEVIPHLYEDYGENFIQKINGMFAIAMWDERRQTLLLYRDRLGIKPLYYYHDDHVFIWGSEIKAILASRLVEKRIDQKSVDLYFRFGYVPAPNSIFLGIKKVLPGQYLRIRDGRITVQSYWFLNSKNTQANHDAVEEELYGLLMQSVKYRLVSDVPLGAFLSGGLDSSFVVGVMQQFTGRPVETFSIKFNEKGFDESKYARRVSSFVGTNHHEFEVEPNPNEIFEEILPYFDEPFADKSAIPAFYVSKFARQHVTVALSGDGGDELFGGYLKYRTLKAAAMYHRLSPALAGIFRIGCHIPSRLGRRIYNACHYGAMNAEERFLSLAEVMPYCERRMILNPDIVEMANNTSNTVLDYAKSVSNPLCSLDEEVNAWFEKDLQTYLVDDVLTKVDRMSMCHSLEVRVPLLDHRVVEYVVSLPASAKLRGFNGKYIFKRVAEKVIPREIINRPKHAWLVPVGTWLRNELRFILDDMLTTTTSDIGEILNLAELQRLSVEHRNGHADHSTILWTSLAFVSWFYHWHDRTFF